MHAVILKHLLKDDHLYPKPFPLEKGFVESKLSYLYNAIQKQGDATTCTHTPGFTCKRLKFFREMSADRSNIAECCAK